MNSRKQNGLLVALAGQSNMLGHIKAVDGPKIRNSAVLAWSNEGSRGTWDIAQPGKPPFNTHSQANSAGLHFADTLQKMLRMPIYLLGRPVNGSNLLSWSKPASPNFIYLANELDWALKSDQLIDSNICTVDSLLWIQGESDDARATMVKEPKLATLEEYRDGFIAMTDLLKSQSWWSDESRFFAAELVDNGAYSARNDFYRDRSLWPNDFKMSVVSSVGLTDIGDRAHYDGNSLAQIGYRMAKLRLKDHDNNQ